MDYAYGLDFWTFLPGLVSGIPSVAVSLVTYILSSLAIYTISSRRGLGRCWMAWVPVLRVWLVGSLSDQYRYVVRGEERNKRKWLLWLNVLTCFMALVLIVLGISVGITAVFGDYGYQTDLFALVGGQVLAIVFLAIAMGGVSIAAAVLWYMAMYDVFKSLDPDNCVLYLVLSILFQPTEAFFLFFNRDKDGGMPPRKPVYQEAAPQEPWEAPQEETF